MASRQTSSFWIRAAACAACAGLFFMLAPTSAQAQDGDPDRAVITGRVPTPVAATDMYIKFPDIKGESSDDKHKGWIDVLSVDWGAAPPTGLVTRGGQRPGGARAASGARQKMTLTKTYDASSPKLALACAEGQHMQSMTMELRGSRAEGGKLMRYELHDVMITSYSLDASGDRPTETITFTYTKLDSKQIPEGEAGKTTPQPDAMKNRAN